MNDRYVSAQIMRTIFPSATSYGRGGWEANGLSADTKPVNCNIVDTGEFFDARWYVVSVRIPDNGTEFTAVVRNKEAHPDSGYDEFSVLHGYALPETDNEDCLFEYVKQCKKY